MKAILVLAFLLAMIFHTACAQNDTTHSTTTATITKTVLHTETVVVDLMTALPGELLTALPGIASASAGDISIELKSVYVQTVELTATATSTATIVSTEIDGVVITSMSTFTAIATSTSTDINIEEVTSFSTKQVGTTITTTSVVPASTSPLSVLDALAHQYSLGGGGDNVTADPWLVFSVVSLCFAHYFFFAHN
ncbi:hypothetical protein D6C78_07115 [Aureobasidium pullulans]|uniref:Uncharacterized protein n=2 Tax=Aureobasidium pullulans TaxID=5580 RepID=A0A074Y2W6_AURPU|nr:uncharacterized protein M438DRAFT_351796 [Aureobasidium pullulans EXF-150]KEQ88542.1 hypothetical protein M438DRAFT_351796 [Aureobasidium pullulans EXF-150]THW06646.1 hypothetical protein D6D26_01417 [Aureobasidium pullulans]THW22679.1 hypothetical protein D6D24_01030 [Aureobasidium pullulans]TIA34045.1 hypothetical protein D6C78_07115 [Aureobasidium pullulans]